MLLGIGAVNFDSSERMTIEIYRHAWKVGHINHMDQVGLAWLYVDGIVLAVVDEP